MLRVLNFEVVKREARATENDMEKTVARTDSTSWNFKKCHRQQEDALFCVGSFKKHEINPVTSVNRDKIGYKKLIFSLS